MMSFGLGGGLMGRKVGGNGVVLADNSQAFIEEVPRSGVFHDGAQLPHVQPHALATGADINLHRAAGFRGQFLTAFRAVHPVGFL